MILQESPCHKNYDNFFRASARWKLKIYGNYGNFFPFFFRILFRIANPAELGALICQKMIIENRPQ